MWLLRENARLNHYMSLFCCVQKVLYSVRFVSWPSHLLNSKRCFAWWSGSLQWLVPLHYCSGTSYITLVWTLKQKTLGKKTVEKLVWWHEVRKALWRGLKVSDADWKTAATEGLSDQLGTGLVNEALSVIPTNTQLTGVQNFAQITTNNYTSKCRSGVRVSG